jgi:hypothetical protein
MARTVTTSKSDEPVIVRVGVAALLAFGLYAESACDFWILAGWTCGSLKLEELRWFCT